MNWIMLIVSMYYTQGGRPVFEQIPFATEYACEAAIPKLPSAVISRGFRQEAVCLYVGPMVAGARDK